MGAGAAWTGVLLTGWEYRGTNKNEPCEQRFNRLIDSKRWIVLQFLLHFAAPARRAHETKNNSKELGTQSATNPITVGKDTMPTNSGASHSSLLEGFPSYRQARRCTKHLPPGRASALPVYGTQARRQACTLKALLSYIFF